MGSLSRLCPVQSIGVDPSGVVEMCTTPIALLLSLLPSGSAEKVQGVRPRYGAKTCQSLPNIGNAGHFVNRSGLMVWGLSL